MRHDGLKTGIFVLSLLLCGAALPAGAQDASRSSVEVDMSVLNAMQPAAGRDPYYQQPNNRAVLTRVPQVAPQAAPAPVYRQQQPQQADSALLPEPEQPYYWPVDQAPPPKRPQPVQNVPKMVSFPITVRNRTELVDPSLEKTSPTSDTGPVKKTKKAAVNPPLPDFKPVAIARRAKEVAAPVPPRRPEIDKTVVHASNGLKREYATSIKDGPVMPAVPATFVEAEPLKKRNIPTISSSDALANSLVQTDKKSMIASIEAIAARVEAGGNKTIGKKTVAAPVPPEKPVLARATAIEAAKTFDITDIEPASGNDIRSIGQAIDITEPAVPSGSDKTESFDLTALPEPVKNSSAMQQAAIPRQPPSDTNTRYEEEYISLPFAAEASALDKETTEKLAADVLPLLKQNPAWRVQIQAFASNADNALKGARRMSLSRALSIRSYLLDQGVEARRMDVRALGGATDRAPADRVDFVFFDPDTTKELAN